MGQVRVIDWTPERTAFRLLADKASMMVWMTEPDGYCFYLNPQWYKFTGQAAGSAENGGWLKAVHPDDRDKTEEAFRKATATRAEYSVEYRLLRQDGEFRWVTAYGNPYYGADGEYHGYIGSNASMDAPVQPAPAKPRPLLTRREREVVEWTAKGKTSDEIGQILGISGRTAEDHLRSSALKLDTANRVQTVVEAIRVGEISI